MSILSPVCLMTSITALITRRFLPSGLLIIGFPYLTIAQINMSSVVSSLDLTFLGAFYDSGPADASFDVELELGEPWTNTSFGSTSAGLTFNGGSPDFEGDVIFVIPDDVLSINLTGNSSAGVGEATSSQIDLVVPLYGYLYADFDSFDTITLVFDYMWTMEMDLSNLAPHPQGDAIAFLDFSVAANGDVTEIGPDLYVDEGFGDFADGVPSSFSESGTGQIQLTFDAEFDGYLEIYFTADTSTYTSLEEGLVLVPESSTLVWALALAIIPWMPRRPRLGVSRK